MYIEYLEEFRQFSHSMNVSKAAKELNTSQPSLSKHIHQLEDELGFPLISRKQQPQLTPEGRYFLGGISQILGSYDALVKQCRTIHAEGIKELVFQEPPLRSDAASASMYRIADRLREEYAPLSIHFTRLNHSNLEELLKSKKINLALVYEFGPIEETIAKYESEGYLIKHLATEHAIVWCNKSNPLAKKEALRIEDIKPYPVVQQSAPYDPLRKAWMDMCREHGFEMKIYEYQTNVYSDYLFADIVDEIYLLLACMSDQTRIASRGNRTLIPFDEGSADIESYLLAAPPSNASEEIIASLF